MIYEYNTNSELFDNGKIIRTTKLLPNGPNIEVLNGNKDYLKFENYVMPYNSDFIKFINTKFSNLVLPPGKLFPNKNYDNAFNYQILVKEFMKFGTPYRGLLVYHGLGSGKTRTCVMVSETFRQAGNTILFNGKNSISKSNLS